MAKKKSQTESSDQSNDGSEKTRIRRPREYRLEFQVADGPFESAGLVLTNRHDSQAVKLFLNNLESTQDANMTYRVTEQIILS